MAPLSRRWGRGEPREGERGQALIEFAFTIPVILLVLIGVVFFAWLFYSFVVLQQATREGAHYAITHPQASDSQVEAEVKKHIGILGPDLVEVTVEGERVAGGRIDVVAEYTFPLPEITIPYLIAPGSYTFPTVRIETVSTMYMD